MTNRLLARLGVSLPIIQAPMAGGGDTPALVAAVSDAGGLGFIGAAYLTPDQIIYACRAVRAATSAPFGVNLFTPWEQQRVDEAAAALEALSPHFRELGLPPPSAPAFQASRFEEQVESAVEGGAQVLSFIFGLPTSSAIIRARRAGCILLGTATSVAEARAIEAAGLDGVIAQGAEAGGHRGSFLKSAPQSLVGTMALVPQMVDAVLLPVIAAGGIMDGRGVAAALSLGAEAVQMGTAFLTTDEAGPSAAYRAALLAAHEDETTLTRAFSGRYARGLVNRITQSIPEQAILPFPLQNDLTRPLRTEAAKQGRAEFLSLWAGQGVGLARTGKAADLTRAVATDAGAILERLARKAP